MKTKELIALLQKADPTGEEHCCVENLDIWNVTREPAFYDGALQIVDRNEHGHPVRGRRVQTGDKINISALDLYTGFEYSDYVIEYANDEDRKRYEKRDQDERRQDKEITFEVEMRSFSEWVFLKIQAVKPIPLGWVDRIRKSAEEFYKGHRGPDIDGKAIEDFPWQGRSYCDRLEELWEELIRVDWDNYSRIIIEYKHQGL